MNTVIEYVTKLFVPLRKRKPLALTGRHSVTQRKRIYFLCIHNINYPLKVKITHT
jgi:hypothetical protein